MKKEEKSLILLFSPIALIVLNIFLFGPFTIFQGNIDEFEVGFPDLLIHFILPAIFLFLVLGLVGVLLKFSQRYISILFALGILIWFQGNILVWKYGLLDGQGINWHQKTWRGWLDISIWILVILLVILFYKHLVKLIKFICVVLISFQLIFLVMQSVQNPEIWAGGKHYRGAKSTPGGLFEFSSKKNALLIILDGFQSDIFQEIIDENPEYKSILQGFTYFKETCGAFPTTKMSVPAILSSKTYKNKMRMSRYIRRMISGNTLHLQLKNAGYEVDLVCGKIYRGNRHHFSRYYSIPRPYGVTKATYYLSSTALVLDMVLFRQSPHFLKRVIYNNQSWMLQQLISKEKSTTFHYVASKAFLQDFIQAMTITKETPVYKLIHVMHPHPPIVAGKDCEFSGKVYKTTRDGLKRQAKCGLDQTIQLLKKMQTMGIYDSSLIVIQADHGAGSPAILKNINQNYEGNIDLSLNDFAKIIGSASPLMLIKKPFSQGTMTISAAQTMITDIPITITSILNIKNKFNGRSMFEIKPGETRLRQFYYHEWKHQNWKKEYFDHLDEYIIKGSITDLNSWQKGKIFYPKGKKPKKNMPKKEAVVK